MNLKNVFTKTILFVFVFQIVMFSPTVFAQMDIITHVESAATEDVKERPPLGEPEIITPIRRSGGGGTVIKKEEEKEQEIPLYYIGLMRRVRDLKTLNEKEFEIKKKELLADLETFMDTEKKKMETTKINRDKQGDYFKLLDTQMNYVKGSSYKGLQKELKEETNKPIEVDVLKNPSQFKFSDDDVKIKSIDLGLNNNDIEIKRKTAINLLFDLFNPFEIQEAIALAPAYLPIIEDVNEDAEAVISYEIEELAKELNNNPVEIANYVQNNIKYEPYFGAKKGSVGCLHEKVCNDADSAILTVALMRAAGIPARYKKGIAVVKVEQLQDLLGVDETKTVYYALSLNHVPVFTVSGNTLNPDIDLADFSGETYLGVEWIYPEIFYNYDEQGANFANLDDLSNITTTTDLQDLYVDQYKKSWIPLDVMVKPYDRVQNEIVHDTAGFDTETFWYDFLQYQGDFSPVEKYADDLQIQTGKDINQTQYQSTHNVQERIFDILPSTLPYEFASGVDEYGTPINIETWLQLPEARRFKVNISVLRQSDNSEVISTDFYGSEINNVPLDLMYEGATEPDQDVIDSYGGIHKTPASLANIKPYFATTYSKFDTTSGVAIGDPLILNFEYYVNGNLEHTDQKLSVAGNTEGIYIAVSQVVDDEHLSDGIGDESEILLEGNARIAWKYLKEVQDSTEALEKALDYESNSLFLRTVITQNRVLAEVGGVPTTFDFQGLTMDASTHITDYSRRGNFHTHEPDFRLLFGEQASYDEAQVIENLTNTNAISTVKGLQYAYANPQTYTMHIIDSGNEVDIDTLSLPVNTKANMHADVQAGNTIITPDKPVSQGNFTGVLYISLASDQTGLYAIGEQNGAWVFDTFDIHTYCYYDGGTQYCALVYEAIYGNSIYLYEDGDATTNLQCNISQSGFDNVLADPGWDPSYGYPCYSPPAGYALEFAPYNRLYYLIATNGTKFINQGGNSYWINNHEIKNRIDNYLGVHKLLLESDLNYLQSGEQYAYKFSTALGTYVQHICEHDSLFGCGTYATVYYVPDSSPGDVYRVRSMFLSKLEEDNKGVLRRLGLPHMDEAYAADSANIQNGIYQQFENGTIYEYNYQAGLYDFFIAVYYTYGLLNERHNIEGGTYGYLGFPHGDPQVGNNYAYQKFEDGESIEWDMNAGTTALGKYKKYNCSALGYDWTTELSTTKRSLILLEGMLDSGINTIDAFGHIGEALQGFYLLLVELNKVPWAEVRETVADLAVVGSEYLIDEYDASVGVDGCQARAAYMTGAMLGEIFLMLIPVDELAQNKLIDKVKTFNALKRAEVVGDAVKYLTDNPLGISALQRLKGKTKYLDHWVALKMVNENWAPIPHHLFPLSLRGNTIHPEYNDLIMKLDNLWGGPGKFDLNDGFNCVFIPQALHNGRHDDAYKAELVNRMIDLLNDPSTTRFDAENAINEIKFDVLNNILQPNVNSWTNPANQEFLDAVQYSQFMYE